MSGESQSQSPSRTRETTGETKIGRGYPLSLLFVIIAGAAIVVSQLVPIGPAVLEERVPVMVVAAMAIVFGVICMVLGMAIGFMSQRRVVGALQGAITGLLLGAVVGPLAVLPRESLGRSMWSALGGCLIIIGLATAVRLTQTPPDLIAMDSNDP